MATAATLAFWFHSVLCVGFVVLAGQNALGQGVAVVESGPEDAPIATGGVSAVFYLSGALYLIYAEVYLYQVSTLARF